MSEQNGNGNGSQAAFNQNINMFLTASMIPTAYTACKNKTYAKSIST